MNYFTRRMMVAGLAVVTVLAVPAVVWPWPILFGFVLGVYVTVLAGAVSAALFQRHMKRKMAQTGALAQERLREAMAAARRRQAEQAEAPAPVRMADARHPSVWPLGSPPEAN